MSLQKEFRDIANTYLYSFCVKHEFEYEADAWVGGDVGDVAQVGDYFFGFDDIRYDIDNQIEGDKILEWHDYNVRLGVLGCTKKINYQNWCKGCPLPYTEEELQKIEDAHKRVLEAERLLYELLNKPPF